MKKLLFLFVLLASFANGQTQIDLTRQVKRMLPLANGGTNNNAWLAGRCVQVSADGLKLEVAASTCGGGGGSTHNLLDSGTHLDTTTTSAVLGRIVFANSTPAWAALSGNTTTIRKMLCQTGNGSISAAPLWCQPSSIDLADFSSTAATTSGQIPIWDQSISKFVPGDPLVQGLTAHDAVGTSTNPVAIGGFASASAPADVSADGDITRAWFKRNGAQVVEVNGTMTVVQSTGSNLHVACDSGCSGSSFSDSTAFTFGSTAVGNTSFVVDDTSTNTVAENSAGAARMNTNRILYLDLSKTAANATAVKVDGSAVTQPVSGTVTTTPPSNASTNVAQVNGVTTSTGSGVMGTGVIRVAVASDNDAVTVKQATGTNLHAVIDSGSTTAVTGSVAVTNAGLTDLDNTTQTVSNGTAGTKSQLIGGVFNTSVPTLTNGQGSALQSTSKGELMVAQPTAADLNATVTGTVTTTPPANASTNVAQVAGTTTDTNSGNKSAGTMRVVLATDQPALTNRLLVTPDSVALPANQSVNVAQVNGIATSTGTGVMGTGVQRVAIASDNDPVTVKQATASNLNADVNEKSINGVVPLMGNGATGTGSQRVTVASDNTPFPIKLDPTTPGTTNAVSVYQPTRTTGTLTSTTCPGSGCVSVATAGYGVATITISGTYSLTPVFEFSDDGGTTNFADTCTRSDSSTQETSGGALVNTTRAWDCSVYAASNFRVRASAFTSGTANIGITLSAASIEAAPTVALATGSNVVGSLAANQSENTAQFGGTNVSTGAGAGGAGIPRVTVSNDSSIKDWDGTNTVAVKAAATSPALADPAKVTVISPNNVGLPVNLPVVVQKASQVSSGSVASINKAFTSNITAGNSIVVVFSNGNNNNAASPVSDGVNTYTKAAQIANSTTLETEIFYAVNVAAGATTVTITPGGSNASITMEIYEISGLIAQTGALSVTATASGTSATAATAAISATTPNEFAITGVGIGTAAQTITAGTGWTNDSGQQIPTTPAGLFQSISMSQALQGVAPVTPQATFTSEPWTIVAATFRPVTLGVGGTVKVLGSNGTAIDTPTASAATPAQAIVIACTNQSVAISAGQSTGVACNGNGQLVTAILPTAFSSNAATTFNNASVTTAVVAKASGANLYGWIATNGSTTTACYLQFMNAASSPTLGTAAIFSVPIAVSSATVPVSVQWTTSSPPPATFTTGLSVGFSTTYNGSTACGTAGSVTLFYK